MHLTVSGTRDAVMMVEAGAKEVTEREMLDGIMFGFEYIREIVRFIDGIVAEIGKPKREITIRYASDELNAAVRDYAEDMIEWQLDTIDRDERELRTKQVKQDVWEHFEEMFPEEKSELMSVLYNMTKEKLRARIIHEGRRPGRPQAQRGASHLVRGGHLRPHPRFRRFHPRPDPGHDYDHPGYHQRGPDPRRHRHRGHQALYAPLQYAPLQHG